MAKQAGPIYFIGTIDDLIFYKQGDQYYVKRTSTCSETTKKKYKTEPRYALMRQRQSQFGTATKLTQAIYYSYLPKAVRKHKLFGKLTGMVNTWLQAGKSREEAQQLLIAYCKKLAAPGLKTRIKGQGTRCKEENTRYREQGTRSKAQGSRSKEQGSRLKTRRSREKEELLPVQYAKRRPGKD